MGKGRAGSDHRGGARTDHHEVPVERRKSCRGYPRMWLARVATQTACRASRAAVENWQPILARRSEPSAARAASEALDTFMAGALVEAGIGAGFEIREGGH